MPLKRNAKQFRIWPCSSEAEHRTVPAIVVHVADRRDRRNGIERVLHLGYAVFMVKAYRDARSFMTAVAEMAEELRLTLIPMGDVERARRVTRLLSDSDMVFGVWPDPNADSGVGVHIIKGDNLMPPLAAFTPPFEIEVAAIPCEGRRQAVAAQKAWG